MLPSFMAMVSASAAASAGTPIMVVDLQSSPQPSLQTVLAVQTCAGLFNRNPVAAGPAYTLMRAEDAEWLALLEPGTPSPPPLTSIADFLSTCFRTVAEGRHIRYSWKAQQEVVPNLLTLAAVLDAVPLEDGSPYLPAQNATLGVPHIASAAVKPTAAAKPTSAAATPTATTDTYSVVC